MFPWKIAKSLEEVFSRWAVKRVCKFMLKKKLGQFILGEIDIDQLDVQLRAGTIQLSDLALNVDYINQKIGGEAGLIVKEGSIGSLLVQMPWKGKGCQVEVDELELVVAPCVEDNSLARGESSISSQDGKHRTNYGLGNLEHDLVDNTATSTSMDVHEGVKTIAKMVKWLLTSFQVNVKKLIVAFDPCLEKIEKEVGRRSILVLRISEIECGTCVSEEANSNRDAGVDSFLGISRLKNFVKFQGASLELLQMEDANSESHPPCTSKTTFGEWFSGCYLLNARTPIITGEKGGFSGTLTLSIPWKNGSLDIRKVDADVCIDPMKLKFQPSTVKWFLLLWESLKNLDKEGRVHMLHKTENSVYYNSESHFHSSIFGSEAIATDKVTPVGENLYAGLCAATGQDSVTEGLLPGSHLISDWVPSSISKIQTDGRDEIDFGASMDQFFECFDDIRTSQSALSSSGLLNWTCSVFGALTAASNLASGSLYVPSEQQHVETNLKATVAGISVFLSFQDEDRKHLCDPKDDQDVGLDTHCLVAECRGILLVLQVCPQEMKFKVKAEHIELAEYLSNENENRDSKFCVCSQTHLVQHLQSEVEGALPPFAVSTTDSQLKKPRGFLGTDSPFAMSSMDSCISRINCTSNRKDDVVKVRLLRTSGVCHCQITVNSILGGSFSGPTSISLELPPFIFWVNFHLVNMLSDLLKEFKSENSSSSEASKEKHGLPNENVTSGSHSCVTASPSKDSLRVNIFLPNARIILCFPFDNGGGFGSYSSWDQFLALDFSSPSTMRKEKSQHTDPVSYARKMHSSSTLYSLNLNVGNLDIHLVTSACDDDFCVKSCGMQKRKLYAQNILSATSRTGCFSVISMLWQEGSVTGPWITKRVKFLATSGNSRSRDKLMGKGYEFASVTTRKDLEDFNSHTRKEIILSSTLFLHVHLSPVTVNLDSSQYKKVHHLLNQVISWLACEPASVREESSAFQTSILVECDSVELSISLDKMENIKSSIQNELSGSWCNFKLKILKFEVMSVSNIGGIKGSNFLRVAHGEGKLWGSVTEVPDKEFLLISCSNSAMKRGDGEGSNALSSWFAGSDIIHLWDPETLHNFTSITVRCCTIVAVGGRLDWLDGISSFFSLPSDSEQADENILQNDDSRVICRASFVLNLVDIGLSYEPYLKKIVDVSTCSPNVHEEMSEQYVACLLAASSLNLSNTTVDSSIDNDYKIRVQDLGILLCAVSGPEIGCGTHSAEHIHNIGYVKVAGEALVEATLRTNCENGLLWEVECSESHIHLDTCSDTFSGLTRLASQLQQLFAPDLEETFVHLQTRWNNVQQAQERNHFDEERGILNNEAAPSQVNSLNLHRKSKPGEIGLMDEICEDAFQLDRNQTCQYDSCESQLRMSLDKSFLREACDLGKTNSETFSQDMHFSRSVPVNGLANSQPSYLQKDCSPEFIEDYCISELRPLSELSVGNQLTNAVFGSKSRNVGDGYLRRGKCGWYGDTSLRIVDNHVSDVSKGIDTIQSTQSKLSSNHCARPDDVGNAKGRVLLRNINIRWKMYAGSDWHDTQKDGKQSKLYCKRDKAVCLELALSGMDFKYDVFPDGEVLVSKLSFSVKDLNFYDNSKDAPWKMVLGRYHSKDNPREFSSKALKVDLEAVRPDPFIPLEEYRVRIAFLPLLLHLHQSQLDFLVSYFGEKTSSVDHSQGCPTDSGGSKMSPVRNNGKSIAEEALLPFIQKLDIWPVLVRVDYTPRRVDLAALRGGKYVELVNLVPWKGVELQLKHVLAMGVYGWSSVGETILGEWLEDISQNQIHKLLQGLPTIRSMVSLSSGAAKLVSLPLENYRKDHKLLKGMQRGTIAFLRSISLEAVGLGVHLAAGAHDILFQAECILTSIPPSVPWPLQSRTKANIRSNQPKDAQQGIQQACESLSDGVGKSAAALLQTPLKKYRQGAGAGSALVTAVRATPVAAIAPASAAARALHCAFLGVRNSLDPEHKKESMEKYLGPTQPREDI